MTDIMKGPVAEILMEILPKYFRPVIEFQQIMKAEGWELEKLIGLMDKVKANNYIQTCDEEIIAYYEKLLGLTYKFGDTLEFRRARIISRMSMAPPFSIGFLNAQLSALFGDGYELSVDAVTPEINIQVTSDRYGAVDLLYDLLLGIVPAHIQINGNQETTNNIGGSRLYVAGSMAAAKVITVPPYNYRDLPINLNPAGFTTAAKVQTI